MAFTYFVPIRKQPGWLTEARLLPIVQSTADVLLTVVPDQPHDNFGDSPSQETIRQAPPQMDRNARNNGLSERHDPMAELIRKNEAAAPKAAPAVVQQKSAAATAKSYGAKDRQALDKLVQTGGER
jgi:hypothetical protein